VIPTLGAIALGWAWVVGSVELEAIRRSVRCRRAPAASGDARGARVLVVRPCAGRDPWLEEALLSLAGARSSSSLTCRLAIADADDAAHEVARASAEALRALGIDAAVVLTAARGPNRKAAQLAAVIAAERAPYDVVLVVDSDVDLTGMDLDALVGPLASRPDLGAVWAPPVEAGRARTLGDRASAAVLGGSLHAFPLLAGLDRGGLVGKLFGVRCDALAAVGGFGALISHLGEDLELGRRLRASGLRIEVSREVARSLASGRSWDQAEERFGRWITVIRAQRPALLGTYPALFLATLPIVGLAALAAPQAPAIAAGAAGAVVVLRLAVAAAAAAAAGQRFSLWRAAIDATLADALLAGAFLRAVRSRRVVWRDVALTIERGGVLRLEDATER
jgi:ceramide glucosyltransferase